MDFSGISKNTILGKILRLPLNLIPESFVMPVLQGKFRGKLWITGSGNHGFWLGSFEYIKRTVLEKTITPDTVVYDVGASVGYYTLLASELVKPDGRVFSFEPLPRNITYLRKHLELNKINNVTVMEKAITDSVSSMKFKVTKNPCEGSVSSDGDLVVDTVSIDFLVGQKEIPPPDFIKMDIEGGEVLALKGAEKVLKQFKPIIFLSTHSKEIHQECCSFLKSIGYNLSPVNNKESLNSTDEIIASSKAPQQD